MRDRKGSGFIGILFFIAAFGLVIIGLRYVAIRSTMHAFTEEGKKMMDMAGGVEAAEEKKRLIEELEKTPEGQMALAKARAELAKRAATQPTTKPTFKLEIDGKDVTSEVLK